MIIRRVGGQIRRISTAFQWPIKDIRISEQTKHLESHWSQALLSSFEKTRHVADGSAEKKKYILSMFPYPSGRLHIGHMRVYTISDATARYYRLNGFDVIHPIGWDSFGLPAENAARMQGVDPREWTVRNIESMREQLLRTRIQFDWHREISTCEPDFFRWTQWIFCRMFERGLVKRVTAEVNWDPVDQTVLAAEQIDAEGRSWRSGAIAEKRKLRQWMVETPKYAKRLQEGLVKLSNQWGEVADIQSNWIGKCDVFRFLLPVHDGKTGHVLDEQLDLRIGDIHEIADAQFVVLRKGHPLVERGVTQFPYKLPTRVLNGVTGRLMDMIAVDDDYLPDMPHHLNCRVGKFDVDSQICQLLGVEKSERRVDLNRRDIEELAAFGGYGGYETSRTLTDWVVSRQRAWGTPIPIILSQDGKRAIAVDDSRLPVLASDRGREIENDKIGGKGTFDTDTLDTFFDSSWYYLRYLDNKNATWIVSKEAQRNMPVDVYVGGIEHAAVHMFFARFVAHFLTDIGVIKTPEPFTDLIPQGIVRGKTFIEKTTGRYLSAEEAMRMDASNVDAIFEKMSKSKNNGVDLAAILETDGVDMTRLRLLESAAPRAPINWGENDMKGTRKLLDRIATIASEYLKSRQNGQLAAEHDAKIEQEIRETRNFFVRNVGMCLEVLHLHNTALMRLHGFTNALKKIKPEYLAASVEGERALKSLVVMLQVFCPHVSAELWSAISQDGSLVCEQQWPQVDADAEIEFLLMVDGVSCGRPCVDRRLVEDLSLDQLWTRAESVEHSEFLTLLKSQNLSIKSTKRVSKRAGFHVTLSIELDGCQDENRAKIGKILDQIQANKRKIEKSGKRGKRKTENEK